MLTSILTQSPATKRITQTNIKCIGPSFPTDTSTSCSQCLTCATTSYRINCTALQGARVSFTPRDFECLTIAAVRAKPQMGCHQQDQVYLVPLNLSPPRNVAFLEAESTLDSAASCVHLRVTVPVTACKLRVPSVHPPPRCYTHHATPVYIRVIRSLKRKSWAFVPDHSGHKDTHRHPHPGNL